MKDLDGLIARVEQATGGDRGLDALLDGLAPRRSGYLSRYTASIDAALGLMERVLPGMLWEKYPDGGIKLWRRGHGVYDEIDGTYVSPRALPLALILATLKALQSLPEGDVR